MASEAPVLKPQHEAAAARGARCMECPLHGCGEGPVMGVIVPGASLTVVGEAPGHTEVEKGEIFSGSAAEVVFEALQAGGLLRSQVSLTQAQLCRPPGGHMLDYAAGLKRAHAKEVAACKAKGQEPPPFLTPQTCCAPRLAQDIKEAGSKTILALGSEALKAVAHTLQLPFANAKVAPGTPKVASLKKQHGSPVLVPDGRILMSSLHPAYTMYGNTTFMPVVRDDIKRAALIAQRGHIEWWEPKFILDPSVDVCVNVMRTMREAKSLVTVDLEADGIDVRKAKIRCVGLGAVVAGKELIIVVPLRHMAGGDWWSPGNQQTVSNALLELMETAPLSGHNLAFDTALMLQQGLMKNRGKHWFDTMVGSHDTNRSELPHDLGFVAAREFEAPRWKDDADHKYVEGISSDHVLHEYCMYRSTPVVMADGSTRLIEDLVRERSTAEVLAMKNGQIVKRPITGWHRQKVQGQRWLNIVIARQRASARGITCTPDHQVLTQKGWIEAQAVQPGDRLHLPEPQLTLEARQAVLGTLLGDTSLSFSPVFRKRRAEAGSVALSGSHVQESRLLANKANCFPELFLSGVIQPAHAMVANGRKGWAKAQETFYSPQLRSLRELWPLIQDTTGLRRLHISTLEQLGPCGLAWWFMDDGCVQKGRKGRGNRGEQLRGAESIVISTQRYPRADVLAAAEWLTLRFGKVNVGADNILRFTVSASRTFGEHIAPWVFAEQRYKLPADWIFPAYIAHQFSTFTTTPQQVTVTAVLPFSPSANDQVNGYAETRYCLDVEDAHSFFTPWGLVHNCAKDVLGEMRLVPVLTEQMVAQDTLGAFRTDTALAPIARDMGDLGLVIDEVRRRKFFDILDTAVTARAAELRRLTGDPDFNPNAFKQVSKFLYITKGLSPPYATDGREWADLASEDEEIPVDIEDPETILAMSSTNEMSLLRLLELGVDEHTRQFIEAELSYRGLQKCKATQVGLKWDTVDGQRVLVDTHRARGNMHTETHGDFTGSVLHPNWKIHVVPTGRMAVSPNVQAWSERIVWDVELYKAALAAGFGEKGKPFDIDGSHGIINTRAMCAAAPGHVLVGADYQQIELRIYAIMSKDALMLDAIYSGKDPHALNYASMMSKKPEDLMMWYERVNNSKPTVRKYLRNIAKRFGFLEIYGGQEKTLYQTMAADRNPDGSLSFPDLKPNDVKMWHNNFHRMHPETQRWQQGTVRAWSEYGYIGTIIDGRKRFFIGGLDPNAIANMGVQGSAAAIANRALLAVAAACPHRGWSPMSGPMLQVHDFIGLQVPLARQQEAEALLKCAMPYKHLDMLMDIDQKSGPSWDQT